MKTFNSLTLVVALAASSVPAFAQITLVTDRALFPTYDTVNWASVGPAFTTLPSPFVAPTTGGSTVTVSHDEGALFERRNETTGGWGGNFISGEALLWNRGDNGAMTFDPTELISGAGFNVMSDFYGAFKFQLDAYDINGGLLGSVTENGNSNQILGTAIFIGFTSTSMNVDKFVATLLEATNGPSDFAINALALAGAPVAPQVAVPEPSTYGLLGALLVMAAVAHRRLRRAANF